MEATIEGEDSLLSSINLSQFPYPKNHKNIFQEKQNLSIPSFPVCNTSNSRTAV